ncbi:MAG TPA: M3 family oligoendopeptidase [Chitinophagales bacterium]|nr:M3 family oligoendopeptidase [Chitinophagales bacterium]
MTTETFQGIEIPERKRRIFVTEDFAPTQWESIEPYYKNLLERSINSLSDLQAWLKDWSELDAVLGEYSRWVYVRTTIDTSDENAKADLVNQYTNIYPKLTVQAHQMDKKFMACPFVSQLDQDVFFTFIRKVKESLELYREENIPLNSQLQMKQSEYDTIVGAQSINYNGQELTMQQAHGYMRSNNRAEREEVFKLIQARKLQDAEKLDALLTDLIKIRHQIALNAGFDNYMEYRFRELWRFDYTPQDCLQFHNSIEEVLMPLVNQLADERKNELGLDVLKPWDREVDTTGKPPLRPFNSTDELVDKTIACFNQLDPYFGERIEIMKQMKYLDLDSRLNKGAGGYNMTMPEIGVPFIFMNSANTEQDLVTMVHEGGHAIHTFLAHKLELNAFKDTTSEIAEVASMAMELMSMEHWDIFYTNPDDLKRARKNQLQQILSVLTKTCLGDSFQFWLYTNPDHTVAERRNKWVELNKRFAPAAINWSGSEAMHETGYHSILHFYVVPFYYIEYAFAQLGSLALWKNFKQDKEKAISDYKKALSLGYTKTIPEFYETAGVKFDFSKPYILSLSTFLKQELQKLK